MKKLISVILSLAMAVSLFSALPIHAEEKVTVEIDGKTIEFDVAPQIIDGRTMVPLRKIFEEIGASVKWDNDTQTVSARKNKKTITLTIDTADLQIDKGKTDDAGNPIVETVALDVPAKILNGRTLVPVRAISESFGLDVQWNETEQKVVIVADDKEDESWKENVGSINLTDLTYEGEGVEINGNQIKITAGGDFALTGTLADGNITVSTKEKVKLRLQGANITSKTNPCIFVEKADKAYITISGDTENVLIAENSDDGAIYSKENLEIKGNGSLEIQSLAGHGMKASDNLAIENGIMTINAASDGIHINDTFKMIGGTLNITAVGDGIDCESIVNISGGTINIETNGTPIENPASENTQEMPRRGMWENETSVEFEKSTKGINAEWMMQISGGEINVNSASHAIHCQDEIEINGGKFVLTSKYDKGISAHGNLTINGAETEIDVTKSTEALESKNVMTINDGVIKAVASDDALNATGGNSGMMPPGGFTPPEGMDMNRGNRPAGGNQGQRPPRGQNGQTGGTMPAPENGQFVPNFGNGEFTIPEGGFPMPEGGFPMPEGGFQIPEGGFQMPEGGFGGGFGGMGRDMKVCLIINGGYLEVCGNDDCIDANGNLTINGGIIKANNPTGSFTGNFGVLDADGKMSISENAVVILAGSNGNVKNLGLTQNNIAVYFANNHAAGETVTVTDANNSVVEQYTPVGSYRAVLIASNNIKVGEKYVISAGEESFEVEITQQSTTVGTQSAGGMGFGRGQW